MIYLYLFWEFFKIGLFSIGGGMATIPFLYEMGERTHWFTSDFITDMVAVSESTPGPIGINMSTYVGFNVAGFFGAVSSCFGLVLPSFLIIIFISKFVFMFSEKKIVKTSFLYLRSCSTGLIVYALIQICSRLFTAYVGNKIFTTVIIYIVLCILIFFFEKIHPIFWLLLGAGIGLFLSGS